MPQTHRSARAVRWYRRLLIAYPSDSARDLPSISRRCSLTYINHVPLTGRCLGDSMALARGVQQAIWSGRSGRHVAS